jgi:DNA-directed RNA polymerase specialized sigma24 family protein
MDSINRDNEKVPSELEIKHANAFQNTFDLLVKIKQGNREALEQALAILTPLTDDIADIYVRRHPGTRLVISLGDGQHNRLALEAGYQAITDADIPTTDIQSFTAYLIRHTFHYLGSYIKEIRPHIPHNRTVTSRDAVQDVDGKFSVKQFLETDRESNLAAEMISELERVKPVVHSLKKPQRKILKEIMDHPDDSMAQHAKRMKTSEGTFRVRLHRARKALDHALAQKPTEGHSP